jgi:aryl-alcohol dehydrogenase-like predicted oxidoreductase
MGESLYVSPRLLGRTGIEVSPLGLSAFSFAPGKGMLGPSEVERAFHEHGIRTFFVGRQMPQLIEGVRRLVRAGHRDEIVLASGAGLPFGPSVRRAFEKNARLLGVDTIDIWLLGWVRSRWAVSGKTWPTMLKLQEEGKVRAIGFSCHDRRLAATLAKELPLDVLMIRYNASHRGAETEVFATLGEDRPGVIGYTATRWGMLLQGLPERGFPTPMTAPECYRFVLAHPSVDMVLCAARTPAELSEDVAGVLAGALDRVRLEEVHRFGDAVHASARGGRRWMLREK